LETPSNVIFRHLRDEGKALSLFAPVYVSDRAPSVPETLTTNELSLDSKQIHDGQTLSAMRELYGKTIVNLGSVLKANRHTPGEYAVADMNAMHDLYIRGALVMSYHDSDGWLTHQLGVMLVKSYSIAISGLIARECNLAVNEQIPIMAVLSMYMCQLLSPNRDSLIRPMLFNRCTYLGTNKNLDEYVELMSETTSKGLLDLQKVCDLIIAVSPERLQYMFNMAVLFRLTKTIAGDTITSMLSIDYPPYWVFALCRAMSGAKIRLYNLIKDNRLQEEVKRFLAELDKSSEFIAALASDASDRMR
jgi:hypothetical protein